MNTPVTTGQVRRVADGVLAVITNTNYADAITAIQVGSPTDEATIRDVIVRSCVSEFKFDLYLMVDGVTTFTAEQLADTPLIGKIDADILHLARCGHRMTTDELAKGATAIGLTTGWLKPQVGDPLWWSRGRAAERFDTASARVATVIGT